MIILLKKRDSSPSNTPWIAVVAAFFGVILLAIIIKIWTTKRRARMGLSESSKVATTGFGSFFKHFIPKSQYVPAIHTRSPSGTTRTSQDGTAVEHELQNGNSNNRHSTMSNNRLSVRSIMTLPPYHVAPLPDEQLIAREGERGGVDTVLEYPESDGEAEERREEEMQTLYSIREARRREHAERASRRSERREAVRRGDFRRVAEMDNEDRSRSRTRNNNTTLDPERNNSSTGLETGRSDDQPDSALLIAQLQSLREQNSTNRRVSSVSYADLGVARHDGSRIRADSVDSDHRPLLDSAASMGGRRDHSRASSIASGRGPSRSRATLVPEHNRRPSTAGSYTSLDDGGDLTPQSTTDDLPPEPPSYEDDVNVHGGEVPPYTSPVATRPPQFPSPTHVTGQTPSPAIVVQDEPAPVRTNSASSNHNPPQLQVNTGITVPPIQVVAATPVSPRPHSMTG